MWPWCLNTLPLMCWHVYSSVMLLILTLSCYLWTVYTAESGLGKDVWAKRCCVLCVSSCAGAATRGEAFEEQSGGAGRREGPVWEETKRHQGTYYLNLTSFWWADLRRFHICTRRPHVMCFDSVDYEISVHFLSVLHIPAVWAEKRAGNETYCT